MRNRNVLDEVTQAWGFRQPHALRRPLRVLRRDIYRKDDWNLRFWWTMLTLRGRIEHAVLREVS